MVAMVQGRGTVEIAGQRRAQRRSGGGWARVEVVAVDERKNREREGWRGGGKGWGSGGNENHGRRPAATTTVVVRATGEGVAGGGRGGFWRGVSD